MGTHQPSRSRPGGAMVFLLATHGGSSIHRRFTVPRFRRRHREDVCIYALLPLSTRRPRGATDGAGNIARRPAGGPFPTHPPPPRVCYHLELVAKRRPGRL
ncbi:hypothetical protein PUNSTDRAFT_48342, partial [Punctularia strigosozonata HHB-11173 SS5]|uniref:uncharacterized protein n=1 Tax=Punctularia strigosozonata (strain HHB-11173) TaxID=741275 RepID=UPI00044169C6